MKKIILTITFVTSIFIMSCNFNSTQKDVASEKTAVTPTEAVEILKGNALLIDVRQPDELAEQSYDVQNSINIPLDSIESKMNTIPKDIQVILACKSGGRSQQAYDLLKEKGFTNITNLEGGMVAWDKAGLPTKKGTQVKTACCANPNSKDCNPDGTCKKPVEKTACCSNPNSKDCNPDGTCKKPAAVKDAPCCSGADKSNCATENSSLSSTSNTKNHLAIYAFHGTNQCMTCKNMKANTKIALDDFFKNELANGTITFQIIDVDDKKNEKLAEKFEATGTALMVNQIKNGKEKIIDLSDMAFEKANDKDEFIADFKTKIQNLLK